MSEVMIRPAVSPDYSLLSSFKHSVQTDVVWQMDRQIDEGQVSISFRAIKLPRMIRVDYPHPSDGLIERAKAFSIVLVACIEGAPVGYIGVSTIQSVPISWIIDMAVHERWRRRGFGSILIRAVRDWSIERDIHRIMIEMSSKNFPAINMARKLGFEFCGYNDYYYHNNDIAIFFTRYLR
jgi:GNAT superfamily N-acetyltransferase